MTVCSLMSLRLIGYKEPSLAPSRDSEKGGKDCVDPLSVVSLRHLGHWLLVTPQGQSNLGLPPRPNSVSAFSSHPYHHSSSLFCVLVHTLILLLGGYQNDYI